MKAAVFDLIERLRCVADGRSLAIDEEMTLVAGDVIVRAIVSRPIQGEEAASIFQSLSAAGGNCLHAASALALVAELYYDSGGC